MSCLLLHEPDWDARSRVTPGEPHGPTLAEQAAVLYDGWLLDVPKLMDVAVLYGAANSALVRRFMRQVGPPSV